MYKIILFVLSFWFSFSINAIKVVSLGPYITRQIVLLKRSDVLVGVTTFCKKVLPPDKKNLPIIGTITDINLEKILQLNPDIVIGTTLTRPYYINLLRKFKIEVKIFSSPRDFIQLCNEFREISQLVGAKNEGEKIINSVEFQLKKIRDKVKNTSSPKVFVQIGVEPLFTAGRNSIINDFIKYAGGMNIAIDTPSGLYSRERVLLKNPDIIIILTMGVKAEKEKKVWMKYHTLSAVKNRKIYILDAYRFCSPTPVSFLKGVKELVYLFHNIQIK